MDALRKRIPDALSVLRVLLVGGFVLLMERARGTPGGSANPAAVIVVLAIALTDILDGIVARRVFDEPPPRGAVIDAVADRLFQWVGVLWLTFRPAPDVTPLPVWFAAVLAAREVSVLVRWIRSPDPWATAREHAWHGKVATASVFGLILLGTGGLPAGALAWAAAVAGVAVAHSAVRYFGVGS